MQNLITKQNLNKSKSTQHHKILVETSFSIKHILYY